MLALSFYAFLNKALLTLLLILKNSLNYEGQKEASNDEQCLSQGL
jgi:hypothetical protein